MCELFLRFPAMKGGRHIKSYDLPRVPANPTLLRFGPAPTAYPPSPGTVNS